MSQPADTLPGDGRARGGARLNLLIFIVIAGLLGFVGYQYVPIAYRATLLEGYMQDTVNNAAITNKSGDWVVQQLRANATDYGLPRDAVIEAAPRANRVEAHVKFTRRISLLVTNYDYKFDQTVRSAAFLTNQ